jgi:anthranilate synthase component 1
MSAAVPDLSEFRSLARDRRVIPVARWLLADAETPLGIYQKLAAGREGTFLLESAEQGAFARYSFIGVHSPAVLRSEDGQARWTGSPPSFLPSSGPALEVLRESLRLLHTEALDGLPTLTGGLVGMLGYDIVRQLERLPANNPDELGLPDLCLLLTTDLAVLDHATGMVVLVANAVNWDDTPHRVDAAYADALGRLQDMTVRLCQPTPSSVAEVDEGVEPDYTSRTSREDYMHGVERAKKEIRAGEAFQIVLSQRFEMDAASLDPLDVYRVLRRTNPSPYMYLLRMAGFDVVGSSPEALVKVEGDRAMTHPIAGTMPRGDTPQADAELAERLLGDEKERAEHLMLVDLGRNDLGRVSRPGTVEVIDFMSVRRYSHVMHIESTVTGVLAEGMTGLDALLACFPAGTLSGAPKVRAMEIIEELEPARRGLYGGVVGYLDFAGDVDTAIAIRTAVLKDGVAYVQAGAGLVADSVPATEDQEARNKAMAVLRAIAVARSTRPVSVGTR